ncbi:MAG TPA: class I SAM-dependent methyltransferase [Candidatus Binatia bacterium]|nr:class I SAM-dependent methyltransferase [Candidatus Binatia bacterium]
MSGDDKTRWDRQHGLSSGADQPSGFLRQVLESDAWHIPHGLALDVATGKGRNAIFLAEMGFRVVGLDISTIALEEARRRAAEKSLEISWHVADLEQIELPAAAYNLIVNFNYLQRSLVPQIRRALKPEGHVIFETYLIDQQAIGHPKNPAYLLNHNELLDHFRSFRVLRYREGKYTDTREASFRAGIFAQKIR